MSLSRYWRRSIDWQDNFLGGQSPKDSIAQWSHELSSPDIESGEFTIYGITQPGTAYQIEINIEGSSPTMLGRYLGCIMIGFMPNEGLEEALLSLRDMLEFYTHKPASHPARLAPKAIDVTIGDSKKRPDLVLSE